jgi:hypothetical protein
VTDQIRGEARAVFEWLTERGANIRFVNRSTLDDCDCCEPCGGIHHARVAGPDDHTSGAEIIYSYPDSPNLFTWAGVNPDAWPDS